MLFNNHPRIIDGGSKYFQLVVIKSLILVLFDIFTSINMSAICTSSLLEHNLNKLENPSFMKVVPNAPQRHEGLMARNTWHMQIEAWSLQFLAEIEEQVAEFRDDNWQKSELYEGDDDYDGSAEAEDS